MSNNIIGNMGPGVLVVALLALAILLFVVRYSKQSGVSSENPRYNSLENMTLYFEEFIIILGTEFRRLDEDFGNTYLLVFTSKEDHAKYEEGRPVNCVNIVEKGYQKDICRRLRNNNIVSISFDRLSRC